MLGNGFIAALGSSTVVGFCVYSFVAESGQLGAHYLGAAAWVFTFMIQDAIARATDVIVRAIKRDKE